MGIYVLIEGQQGGPFTEEEMRILWDAGELPPDAAYWYEGMHDWLPIAEFQPPPVARPNVIPCPDCGGSVSIRASACPHCGAPTPAEPARKPIPPEFTRHLPKFGPIEHSENSPRCPKCRTTHVHAEKRGWSLATGFIGSGKIMITCLKCGTKFEPGHR